jgi:F-type H+-transporting ATPase subunit b
MQIDWWTLALQTVNVLALIWILARFFFRPIADIVAKRQDEANNLLADAAKVRDEAAGLRAAADKARAESVAERDRLIAEARKAAQTERSNLLTESSREVDKLRNEAKAEIARGQAAAEQAIIAHAGEVSIAIAQRLLKRFPAKTALSAFLDGLCEQLRGLSASAKESIVSVTNHPIEIVTAATLSNEETEEISTAIKNALGCDRPFVFRSDPALFAGIELRSRNTIVRNSFAADFVRIREELSRDERLGKS